ncbi:MAG: hypothetical protein L3J69_01070 [Desulfobacula sp.]|nr:hypothetical protein [Desulfobacula sp.]
MLEKVMEFAESGKGRRLLNTLNKKDIVLTSSELDKILTVYRDLGLPIEIDILKRRRGILRNDQYDALARTVKDNCCSEKFDDFAVSLGNLLSSGMKMNPAKMKTE